MNSRLSSFIWLLFLFMILSVQSNAGISLTEALKKGLVKATLQGSKRDSTRNYLSSYYGPCITLSVQSMSKSALNLNLESGRLLETLTWKFRYKGFPKGVYYVKLITKNKDLVASRPIVVD